MTAKPGYKTTEFWVTVVTAVYGLLNMSGALEQVSNWHGGIILTIATAAYAIARGLAKRPAS
jgi:hypothetical protein